MLRPDTPVQFLKGVGPQRAEAFERMGVRTIEDLLYHIPHRYLTPSIFLAAATPSWAVLQ